MLACIRSLLIAFLLLASAARSLWALDALAKGFAHPPDAARPWVYWFWNNGNVTKEGITADLEAMQRVGIGGVLIMDVLERFAPPKGTATFMGAEWQKLFAFALAEANRLGLEVNMTNGPGWCGSSGPWITPALSMQQLVTTDTPVEGPLEFVGTLPKPVSKPARKDGFDSRLVVDDYYRDVAVLAFPEAVDGVISRESVVDLTGKMNAAGHLSWEVPAGKWTIHRIGHASTGSSTRPPVLGGNGLECDKLSREAMDVHFAGMMKKLIDQAGPLAGKTLTSTHIDSWEVGGQNWTARFREEFQKRRGYDPVPLLPCVTGLVHEVVSGKEVSRPKWQIGGKALAERFRWDFQQTISELLAENYSGRLAELAHERGLRLSMEGYDLPFGDEATYTAVVDEPMTEFWTPGKNGAIGKLDKAQDMASVAHTSGQAIVGAEAFTSGDGEQWKLHPATIKALGDNLLSRGVNRFVFHRYAHQPWLDKVPGATMGPWGLHYERTNTWWEMSGPWHEYLSRCQFMLRQGHYVADLLYLRPEVPHQTGFKANPAPPAGYRYDACSAQALIARASVKDGRIVLPDGMSYRMLILPPQTAMTPALLNKLCELVAAGAVISGAPPKTSPSLSGYPECDKEVARLAKDLWGESDGKTAAGHAFGKGTVFSGVPLPAILEKLQLPPDFTADMPLNWIHRRAGLTEVYFVANPQDKPVTARCTFRVAGMQPEYWNPERGTREPLPVDAASPAGTTVTLQFDPAGSAFVVFRKPAEPSKKFLSPFLESNPAGELTGPWKLRFPPNWGAPEKITLPNLISWSECLEPGVKYFSGTAIYAMTFTPENDLLISGQRVFLNLGDVQVMARVKLNDRDLGILWKPPFRAEVTDILKLGENRLEIEVVNLWPNRMIGDAAQPPDKRYTWSSWEPFKIDTPLLKSGLLGPVCFEIVPKANDVPH